MMRKRNFGIWAAAVTGSMILMASTALAAVPVQAAAPEGIDGPSAMAQEDPESYESADLYYEQMDWANDLNLSNMEGDRRKNMAAAMCTILADPLSYGVALEELEGMQISGQFGRLEAKGLILDDNSIKWSFKETDGEEAYWVQMTDASGQTVKQFELALAAAKHVEMTGSFDGKGVAAFPLEEADAQGEYIVMQSYKDDYSKVDGLVLKEGATISGTCVVMKEGTNITHIRRTNDDNIATLTENQESPILSVEKVRTGDFIVLSVK